MHSQAHNLLMLRQEQELQHLMLRQHQRQHQLKGQYNGA
jgi:hypothetical protein